MTQTTDRLAEVTVAQRAYRMKRAAEMSANIIRDARRTGGWAGAENTARAFDRLSKDAAGLQVAIQSLSTELAEHVTDLDKAQAEVARLHMLAKANNDLARHEANGRRETQQQLKTVLDREAETHARHDAKVDALEQRIAELEAENARLRAVVLKYADDLCEHSTCNEGCGKFDELTCGGCFARAALNPQPTGKETDTACFHQWQEVDSQFSNEHFTDVKCSLCNERGQRDEKTGEVFWPAT